MKSCPCIKLGTLAALVICFAFFGSAVGAGPNTTGTEPNSPAKAVPGKNVPVTAAPVTAVAVTVDGVNITDSDIDAEVAKQLRRMRIPPQLPPQFIEQYKKQLRKSALDNLIIRVLLDEQVKAKVTVTDEEVIDYLKKMGATRKPPLTLEDIKKRIEAAGQSFDQMKRDIHRGLGYQKLMETQWAGKVNITEADARKFYDENPKQFKTPEMVRASHILIQPDKSDPNVDPNQAKAKARAKAEALLKQIKNGADFATLAKANSNGPSAARGGDLGLKPRGTWVKPFEDAEFSLKVGQVSDIVETQFGYHIIKVTDHKDPNTISFEQAKENIINKLTKEKRDEIARSYIKSLKEKAKITYPPGREPKATQPSIIMKPVDKPKATVKPKSTEKPK